MLWTPHGFKSARFYKYLTLGALGLNNLLTNSLKLLLIGEINILNYLAWQFNILIATAKLNMKQGMWIICHNTITWYYTQ